MFVIRYMVVAIAVLGAVVAWGVGAQHSLWQIIGMAAAAVFGLQMMILAYVAWAVARTPDARRRCPGARRHLVILPR